MNKIFKRWISLITSRPKIMVAGVFIITIIFSIGVSKLRFETSLNYLMPKDEPVYMLGQRANMAFIDSETFIITSIEPANGHNLFSNEVFTQINKMVQEIDEYREFDRAKEDQRIQMLLSLSGVSIKASKSYAVKKDKKTNPGNSPEETDIEAQLDEYLLNGGNQKGKVNIETIIGKNDVSKNQLWDLSKPLSERRFENPGINRQIYNYSQYKPLSLLQIKKQFGENSDENALAELDTILLSKNLIYPLDHPLSAGEFKKILEAWQDIYLFKSMEIVQIFMNPITGKDISGKNNQLTSIDFLPRNKNGDHILPSTRSDFLEFQNKIRLNPLHKNLLYSENESGEIQALAMSVILKSQENYVDFSNYFIPLFSKYNRDNLFVNSMGSVVLAKYMSDYMKGDLMKFMPVVLIMIILTFYLNFRSFTGILLPTLTLIIASIWTMGLMGFLDIKITLAVSILPPLLIAVGSSYAIHIYNQYMKDDPDLNLKNSDKTLTVSVIHISGTVFLAAVTTIISFMTFILNQVTSLRDFGIFASLGTFFAMVVAFIFIPAGLMIVKPKSRHELTHEPHNPVILKVVHGISYFAMSHTKKTAALFLVLLTGGIIGISQIRTETAPLESFKRGSPIRIADNRLNKLFSGTVNLTLILDSGKKNGALDPEFLNWVENLRDWLDLKVNKENYSILSNYSFSDVIKRMEMAFHSDKAEYFKLPADNTVIRQYIEILSGEDRDADGRPDQIEQFIDKDYQRVNLIIRTGSYKKRTISSTTDRNIIKVVTEHLQKQKNPNQYKWFFVGTGVNMLILSDYIVTGQIWSTVISLLMMMIVVYLFFKKLSIALLSMIPLVAGIAIVYGMMGFLGIPLDIPRAILSSIAVGVGIDNTIHFLKTMSHYIKKGKSYRKAMEKTFHEAGIPIVYTALALILGFSALTLSSFVPIFSLGLLVSSVLIVTTISALLFLPAFILLFHPEIKPVDDLE